MGRPEDVLVALGRAEETLGHAEHALQAYRRVYYDYPLSTQSADASDGIARVETTSLLRAGPIHARAGARAAVVRRQAMGAGACRLRASS